MHLIVEEQRKKKSTHSPREDSEVYQTCRGSKLGFRDVLQERKINHERWTAWWEENTIRREKFGFRITDMKKKKKKPNLRTQGGWVKIGLRRTCSEDPAEQPSCEASQESGDDRRSVLTKVHSDVAPTFRWTPALAFR